MADQELDLRGLNCPIPVMRVKKKMLTMAAGQHVLASDPGTIPDFKAYVKSSGDTLLESKKNDNGDFEFMLKRA